MLKIRNAQLEVFRAARRERFISDMLAHLASEYPQHVRQFGPGEARRFVERSMAAADGLGITTAGSVGALAELWLVYGEKLERSPDRQWASNILAHPTLPDYIKVGAVQDRLSERAGGRVMVVHRDPA